MKIKVCGMRDTENIKELIAIQPDFIGFIFHEKSPRNVSEKLDINIPKTIKKVGVFVDKSNDFITKKTNTFKLDYIQLHGKETPIFCTKLNKKGFKIIKAFRIKTDFNFDITKAYENSCDYFIFDAFGKYAGGNGITFNWNILQNYHGNTPFLLSGGINKTLTESIKKFKHPKYIGIDINSGFEIAPAKKNITEITEFKQKINS